MKINKDSIIMGHTKVKIVTTKRTLREPKHKFRIIIQERKNKDNTIEKCRSFMIYDFKGRTVDQIKKKLQKQLSEI